MVPPLLYLFRINAAQHFQHMNSTEALTHAVDSRQQFLYDFSRIKRHRWIQTGIAIAARLGCLSKIIQQTHPPASQGFA